MPEFTIEEKDKSGKNLRQILETGIITFQKVENGKSKIRTVPLNRLWILNMNRKIEGVLRNRFIMLQSYKSIFTPFLKEMFFFEKELKNNDMISVFRITAYFVSLYDTLYLTFCKECKLYSR